jgi:threonine/homoserine/homoserine lactone efflux protein
MLMRSPSSTRKALCSRRLRAAVPLGFSAFPPQVTVLEATFVILAILNSAAYAVLASATRQQLRQARERRIVNRTGGALLIGAGALAAGWRKAAA